MKSKFKDVKLLRASINFIVIIVVIIALIIHGVKLMEAGSNFYIVHAVGLLLLLILFIWMGEVPYIKIDNDKLTVNRSIFSKHTHDLNALERITIENPNTSNPKLNLIFADGRNEALNLGPLSKNGRQKLLRNLDLDDMQ